MLDRDRWIEEGVIYKALTASCHLHSITPLISYRKGPGVGAGGEAGRLEAIALTH